MPRLTDDPEEGQFSRFNSRYNLKKIAIIGGVAVVGLLGLTAVYTTLKGDDLQLGEPKCPLPAYFSANSTAITDRSKQFLSDKEFIAQSYEKLSQAVKVPTEVYDGQPEVKDHPEVWAKFGKFHHYLEKTFPTVYEHLQVDKVNTWGLVFTWKGKNADLKPVLLTAHQDVVPVQADTIKDWKYDPFSGHIGKDFIYGRGVSDCKNLLVGLMETVEQLLADGFKPQRSIVLAFGFDEEASGGHGARHISHFLTKKYGKDSFYAVIDEGSSGLIKGGSGQYYAQVATGEKGFFNAEIQLTTPGGHSSVPPDHTSIGIMSSLVKLLETETFEPILTDENPTMGFLQCLAEHDTSLPTKWRSTILKAVHNKAANLKVLEYLSSSKLSKFLVRTSQAVDIIKGGAKSNALPEHVSIISNYRVAIGSNVAETVDHVSSKIQRVAQEYNVGYVDASGKQVYDISNSNGYFNMSVLTPLEPAPLSPTTKDSKVWMAFGGALRHFYKNVVGIKEEVIVTPGIMTGNTDTKYYWDLTRNIYRFIPGYTDTVTSLIELGIHSVNEKLPKVSHLHVIAFYYEYLQAIDKEADEE
ncbi:hypothetical protein BABINDRAFT_46355 [Babjeviella inositovora NRRL Y-12698]|uniref:Peptidase M20 dimerisation domain-containing protein n=1 Tax=Babjeviella inositovora NRRL Y-12698 TaxID=984486 RepID=A0A1E3QWV1_9ASCO|nr:uncharacterized protein BABINDRAFT_46355 [Babjeviella inositovora NRRL Y-12698]ODQ82120.1 hypothetical protein BABINDRAFT_46355 [Babjeviella inositovora NRRL Y-12698]